MPDLNQTVAVTKPLAKKEIKKEGEETLTVWTPAAGKKFRLFGFTLFTAVATEIKIQDEGTVIWAQELEAKTGATVNLPGLGYQSVTVGNKLKLNLSATSTGVTGTFYGVEDAY